MNNDLEKTAGKVILLHGKKNFKDFRGNGFSPPEGGYLLFQKEKKQRGELGSMSEYSVGESIILKFTTDIGSSFIEELLAERKIDYTEYPY